MQLRERDIKHLNLVLDHRKGGNKIIGVTVANCVGAISRKCYTVKIALVLNGAWPGFVKQLEPFGLANVTKLEMFLGLSELGSNVGQEGWSQKL